MFCLFIKDFGSAVIKRGMNYRSGGHSWYWRLKSRGERDCNEVRGYENSKIRTELIFVRESRVFIENKTKIPSKVVTRQVLILPRCCASPMTEILS